MSNQELIERRKKALGPSYQHFYDEPVHLVRGEGVWLYDADGKKYLDCYNNVASVGHCHPRVVEALSKQASTLNTHTRYLHENVVNLSERITATLPGELSVCMFVCTGTEANDLAMRIARIVTGNEGAIVSEFSYHGNSTLVNTLSTADCDDRPDWLALFEAPCSYRTPFKTDDNLSEQYANLIDDSIANLAAKGHKPAAIMIDSIFDCPGTIEAPKDYFKNVYDKVHKAGGLTIADEVQSGFCRTGDHYWGFEHYDVIPDIVTMGKPMGAGHPLAAVVTTPEIAAKFAEQYGYFNTFGGNPVSTAVGLAVLDVIKDEHILDNVTKVGAYLKHGLEALAEKYDLIGDVRGKGLFLSVDIVKSRDSKEPDSETAKKLANMMRDEGVLVSTHGRYDCSIKIRPPMVFSQENADLLIATLDSCFANL